jgi:hypothetical protein
VAASHCEEVIGGLVAIERASCRRSERASLSSAQRRGLAGMIFAIDLSGRRVCAEFSGSDCFPHEAVSFRGPSVSLDCAGVACGPPGSRSHSVPLRRTQGCGGRGAGGRTLDCQARVVGSGTSRRRRKTVADHDGAPACRFRAILAFTDDVTEITAPNGELLAKSGCKKPSVGG